MGRKYIYSIFIILLLITFTELSYYLYLNFSNKNSINNRVNLPLTPAPQTDLKENTELPLSFHPVNIEFFSKWRRRTKAKVYVTTESETHVVEIAPKGLTHPKHGFFPYAINRSCYDPDCPQGWLYLPEFALKKTRVYRVHNNISTPVNILDIKVGDTLFWKEVFDPMYLPTDERQLIEQTIQIIE